MSKSLISTLIVGLISTALTYHLIRTHLHSARTTPSAKTETGSSCPINKFNTTKRVSFSHSGAQLYSWPSTGGVLIKEQVDGVELDFLTLDRFRASARSTSSVMEDRFCKQLRRIGAKWWSSEGDYMDAIMGARERLVKEEECFVFGWPMGGGVLVLRFGSERDVPGDLGRIHMAFMMEDRCLVMMGHGAEFFENAEDCTYLSDLPA